MPIHINTSSILFRLNKTFKRFITVLIFLILVSGSSYFSIKYHDTKGIRNWRSEIFADAAGYNIYLPAMFIYNWDGKSFPVDIEKQTGTGFNIDPSTGKIFTKYTCGVAFMQLPFFLAANLISNVTLGGTDGYNYLNYRSLDIAGCFYMWLGFFFIFFMLRKKFSFLLSAATACFIVFGSNVFFYGFIHPGMSHIYSFAVFAAFLWSFDKISEYEKFTFRQMFIAGSLLGIATLIRPTNIFIGLVFIFWNTFSWKDIKLRLKKILTWKPVLATFFPCVLLLIPQMIYWNYAFDSPLLYSYKGEGFTNWKSPELITLWFEPNNGLFPYAPILVLIFTGIIITIIKKNKSAFLPPVFFVLMSYVFASWYMVSYGSSFGCRPFAEFFVFFSLPLASLIHIPRNKLIKSFIVIIAVACMLFTIKMTLIYNDNYFMTTVNWNWKEYKSLIGRGIKIIEEDFEDCKIIPGEIIETNDPGHGEYILAVSKDKEFPTVNLEESYTKGTYSPWRYANVSVDVKADTNVFFLIVYTTDSCGKQVKWSALDVKYDENKLNQWQTIHLYDAFVGGEYGEGVKLKFYLWNSNHQAFYFDNLKVFLH